MEKYVYISKPQNFPQTTAAGQFHTVAHSTYRTHKGHRSTDRYFAQLLQLLKASPGHPQNPGHHQ